MSTLAVARTRTPTREQLAAYAELLMQVRISVRRVYATPPGLIGMHALNGLVAQGRSDLVLFTRHPVL